MPYDHFPDPATSIAERALHYAGKLSEPLREPLALDPDYLVKNLLGGAGTVSILRGPSNVGKSAVAVAIAAHVAEGRDLLRRKVRRGGVLYVAAEAPGSIRMRLEPYRERLQGCDPIHLLAMPPDLRAAADVEALVEVVRDLRPAVRLIVVDTLICALGDGDENNSRDMHAVIGGARRLAEAVGAHVMLVHHTGHQQDRMRGSSALVAAVDTEIALAKGKDEPMPVRLSCPKQRDMAKTAILDVRLGVHGLGTDRDGDTITTVVATFELAKKPVDKPTPPPKPKMTAHERWETVARETLRGMPGGGATAAAVGRAVPPDHPLVEGAKETSICKGVRTALRRLAETAESGVTLDGDLYRIARDEAPPGPARPG